jgi:ubiquinone/menaquinone biosynthesis C-methylase UbiE
MVVVAAMKETVKRMTMQECKMEHFKGYRVQDNCPGPGNFNVGVKKMVKKREDSKVNLIAIIVIRKCPI